MSANGGGPATDPSAALAEKLLQGWALLQEHCPQCLTPLVRNRQRKMYCVACDQWILTQAEAAQKILQERVGEEEEDRRSSDMTTHVAPHPSPAVNSNHIENGQSEQILPSDRRESSSVLEAGYSSETLNLALSKISTILVKKLEELGDNLLRSHDVEATRSAMIAVRECLQTISDVKQLQT